MATEVFLDCSGAFSLVIPCLLVVDLVSLVDDPDSAFGGLWGGWG